MSLYRSFTLTITPRDSQICEQYSFNPCVRATKLLAMAGQTGLKLIQKPGTEIFHNEKKEVILYKVGK